VDVSGGTTGLTTSGGPITSSGTVTLAGTLIAANGGTGLTASGTVGNVLTSTGTTWTSSAPAAGGIVYTTTKTANYAAVANDGVLTNTTAGAFTVTLPASPSNGAQVIVADAGGTWGTNNLTVGRNGNLIADVAQDLVCDISGVSVQFVYNSSGTATWEVYAQVGGNGGTVVTLDGTQTLTNKTLTAPTIASANLTTALTLAGAAGTNGQVLTSAGSGLPSWTTPSAGALALLSTVTISNSATADVETTFNSTYDTYMIVGKINTTTSASNPELYCRLKIGGSYVTTADYAYQTETSASNSTAYVGLAGNSQTQIVMTPAIVGNAARSVDFVMYVQNPTSTAEEKSIFWTGRLRGSSGHQNKTIGQGSYIASTAALTGVRFYTSSDNLVSGYVRLYGIAKT
jgi:hypothetical protein